jgi:hypothetical protein
MQRSLAISSSGLRHADTRQWATAHNSANLTAATTVVRTTAVEQPVGGGVWKGVEGRFEQRFQLGAIDAPMGRSVDAVDLAVEQIATVSCWRCRQCGPNQRRNGGFPDRHSRLT